MNIKPFDLITVCPPPVYLFPYFLSPPAARELKDFEKYF
jgi:hypothetical protein